MMYSARVLAGSSMGSSLKGMLMGGIFDGSSCVELSERFSVSNFQW